MGDGGEDLTITIGTTMTGVIGVVGITKAGRCMDIRTASAESSTTVVSTLRIMEVLEDLGEPAWAASAEDTSAEDTLAADSMAVGTGGASS